MDTLKSTPADIKLFVWRERLSGILFVALMAAVMQIAALPAYPQPGPLTSSFGHHVRHMVYGNFLHGAMPAAWNVGVNFFARRLLRIAVAFYGLHISVQQIIDAGLPGLTVSVAIVTSTLVLGTVLGQRLLGLDRDTAMLTAAGSAICGAAAVLALEPTLRAAPHKSTVAVATVVLFGTLSMFFYPLAYRLGWLSLDMQALGIFIGGTIHEVAQVVGARQQCRSRDNAGGHDCQNDVGPPCRCRFCSCLACGCGARPRAPPTTCKAEAPHFPSPGSPSGSWPWRY